MRYFLCCLFAISFASGASNNVGTWGTTCNEDGFYFPFNQKTSSLVVNDNQIVISVHSIINNRIIDVYLDRPLDLGRGGMNIKWSNIDKSKKIAELKYKNNSGDLQWLGFFDKKTNKYFWSEDPDFVQLYSHDGIVKMKKCQ